MARFDWIRFDPDGTGGGGDATSSSTTSTARALGAAWTVVRQDQSLRRERRHAADPGGARRHLRRHATTPRTSSLRDRLRRAVGGDREAQLRGHRPVPPGRASWSTATTRTSRSSAASPTPPAGDEKFEFIYEVNAVAAQRGRRLDGQPRRRLPERLLGPADVRRDERHRPLLDRRHHVDPGRARRRRCRRTRKLGLFAFSNDGTGNPSRRSTRSRSPVRAPAAVAAVRPARAATTSSTAPRLDKDRWNAIVRDNPAEYSVAARQARRSRRSPATSTRATRTRRRTTSSCSRRTTPALTG